MKIKIEAPDHPNQASMREFYTEKLEKKYGTLKFLNTIELHVNEESDKESKVTLKLIGDKAITLYATAKGEKEYTTFTKVVKKIDSQISKYKKKHYRSGQKGNPDALLETE